MLGLEGWKTAEVVVHKVLECSISTPLQARLTVWFWNLSSKDIFQACVDLWCAGKTLSHAQILLLAVVR